MFSTIQFFECDEINERMLSYFSSLDSRNLLQLQFLTSSLTKSEQKFSQIRKYT